MSVIILNFPCFSFIIRHLTLEPPIQNHLLKSPFAVHPKTGRVCVPIDPYHCETFNPFSVPTLGKLEDDINNAGAAISSTPKTSLGPYVEVFEKVIIVDECISLTLIIRQIIHRPIHAVEPPRESTAVHL